MKRNVLLVGAVVVVAAGALAILSRQNLTASAATTAGRPQTATVQRGSLAATVSAAGNIASPKQSGLAFQTNGRVTKVNVQVGDVVKKDQVLMELDSMDQQLALKTAQSSLASAQAGYDAAKINNSQNPNQLVAARATLDKARVALEKAQADYNAVAWRPDVGMTTQASALQQAYIDYTTAEANYNTTAAGFNDTALRTAQAQLDSAQVAVEQAQVNLNKTKIVAPFDGVVAAVNYSVGDSTGSSAASTSSSSSGSGTGSSSGSSTAAITLADLKNLKVNVLVAEVDMPKIKIGQTAQMTLDALSGKTYTARVTEIGPVGTVTQGVVNFPVTLEVTNQDNDVKPGMTANLSVVYDQRQDVLVVPIRAVRSQGNQKSVTVFDKDQTTSVPVTTGLANEQFVEITSGLHEGDVVVVNATQTGNTRSGPGGPPNFVFPIGR